MRKTFSVPEVSCGHCKQTIESALIPVAGVGSADVDIDSRSVEVAWDPDQIEEREVISAIESTGYSVGR